MDEVSDEMLMAYVDGELDAETRALVETLLAGDPARREKLRVYEVTRDVLARVYGPVLDGPVPERLTRLVDGRPASVMNKDKSRAVRPSLWEDLRRRLGSGPNFTPAFAGAAVAVVAGVCGWSLAQTTLSVSQNGAGMVAFDGRLGSSLAQVLETALSDQEVKLGDAGSVIAKFTFRAKTGNFCRQYEFRTVSGQLFDGVACREGAGQWRMDTHTAAMGTSGSIETSSVPLVNNRVEQIIDGELLANVQEEQLIRNRWN